ncbi:MAG TPA: hypothetical protein ACFYD3_05740 [Candidatus Hypogeohydataceae bacterium YC41]
MAETTGLEERVAHIEGTTGQLDKRLGSVEIALQILQRTVEEKFQEMSRRLDSYHQEVSRRLDSYQRTTDERFQEVYRRMDIQFRWTVGIMLTMWVTIILTILVKLK